MIRKNSILPPINDGPNSSLSKDGEGASREGNPQTLDFLWKNPSLKLIRTPDCRGKRSRVLGQQRNELSTFLCQDITTFPTRDTSKTKRAIVVNEFVKNYVYIRESCQDLPFEVTGSSSSFAIRKYGRHLNRLSNKNQFKEISLPPLEFTEEVIRCRGDPCLSSYFSADVKELYKIKGLCISRQQNRPTPSNVRAKRRGFPPKHKLCISSEKDVKLLSILMKPKCPRKKELVEDKIEPQAVKSTHVWEKYVLGLISKETAQWIANQCCTGEQRSRLIDFLDEKYEIEDVAKNGAATVHKLLAINDDAISPPVKKDKQIAIVN